MSLGCAASGLINVGYTCGG